MIICIIFKIYKINLVFLPNTWHSSHHLLDKVLFFHKAHKGITLLFPFPHFSNAHQINCLKAAYEWTCCVNWIYFISCVIYSFILCFIGLIYINRYWWPVCLIYHKTVVILSYSVLYGLIWKIILGRISSCFMQSS